MGDSSVRVETDFTGVYVLYSLFECHLDIIFGFYLRRNSTLFAWQATIIGLVEDAPGSAIQNCWWLFYPFDFRVVDSLDESLIDENLQVALPWVGGTQLLPFLPSRMMSFIRRSWLCEGNLISLSRREEIYDTFLAPCQSSPRLKGILYCKYFVCLPLKLPTL